MKKNLSAFTLVELAIVIVIIGLLVGGVLQGQELIRQAKVRAQIKQFSEFDASALTFKAKYGYIPGDIPTDKAISFGMTGGNCNGCPLSVPPGSVTGGNNILDDNDYGYIPNLSSRFEGIKFFVDMSELKMIKDYLRFEGTNKQLVGRQFPVAKIGNGGIAAFNHTDGIYYFMGPNEREADSHARFYLNSPTPSISPSDASIIDDKIDNGVPSSGLVRAIILHFTNPTVNFSNDSVTNSCLGASNQVYNMNSDDLLCRIIVKSKVN